MVTEEVLGRDRGQRVGKGIVGHTFNPEVGVHITAVQGSQELLHVVHSVVGVVSGVEMSTF